tara:strand:- start:1667 stop:2236 length:570 start_codon:yes stop_codon:yes gene_type:complete
MGKATPYPGKHCRIRNRKCSDVSVQPGTQAAARDPVTARGQREGAGQINEAVAVEQRAAHRKVDAAIQPVQCSCGGRVLDSRPIKLVDFGTIGIDRRIVTDAKGCRLRFDLSHSKKLRQIKATHQPDIGRVVGRGQRVGPLIDQHADGKVRVFQIDTGCVTTVDHPVAIRVIAKYRAWPGKDRGLGQCQ